MLDKYGYDRRTALRALNLAETLQKTDRILTGNGRITVSVKSNSQATYSIANAVEIGVEKLNLGNSEDLLAVLGMNYHELAHILFTPRLTTEELSWRKSRSETVYLKPVSNFLEEARIETMFGAMWPKAKHFFTVMLVKILLGKYEKPSDVMHASSAASLGYTHEQSHGIWVHLLTYGRKYLPADLRASIREWAVDKLGSDRQELQKLDDAEAIIDEYRLLPRESVRTRGKELAILLAALYPNFFEYVEQNDRDGGVHSPVTSGSVAVGNKPDTRQNAPSSEQKEAHEKAVQDEADGYEEIDLNGAGDGDGEDEDSDDDAGSGSAGRDHDDEDEDTDEGQEGAQASPGDRDEDGDDGEGGDTGTVGLGAAGGEEDADPDGESARGVGQTKDAAPQAPTFKSIEEALRSLGETVSRDRKVQRDLAEVEDALDSEQEKTSEHYIASRRNPTGDEKETAQRLGREFEKLAQAVAPGWNYGSDTGRLNVQRAMDPDADPDTIFDEWEEGREQDASVEAVICVDLSGSMQGGRVERASSFAWIVARALSEVDAKVTVYGFSNEGEVYTLRGRDDRSNDDVPEFKVVGGTSPAFALNAARQLLNASDIENRALIVMTDGQWGYNSYEVGEYGWRNASSVGETYAPILSEVRAHRTFIGISTGRVEEELTDLFDVVSYCTNPTDLVEPVLKTIEGMVRSNVFHGN
jgi:Mg-chelatase subunit ChlD